jgi:hypothetical protein
VRLNFWRGVPFLRGRNQMLRQIVRQVKSIQLQKIRTYTIGKQKYFNFHVNLFLKKIICESMEENTVFKCPRQILQKNWSDKKGGWGK